MTFTSEIQPSRIGVVRGQGKLNMITAPELRSVVLGVLGTGVNRIVVDLGGIEFMDSSGLGALVSCLKSARQAGGDLRIAAPSTQVSMVLQLSNLDRVLATSATVEDAFGD